MSQTFHSKYHRANHMTLKNPNLPDAGWDPIASDTVPFSGDFWMAKDYAVHSNYIKPATGTSVTVDSDKFNVLGDSKFAKTITVDGYEYIHGADDNDYGLKVDNKIYAGGMDITGDLIIDGNCYITQEITASTGEFEEVSAQSATADVLYVTQLLSAVSATFHNIDITATEASGFIITGERPEPTGYYEIPDPLPEKAQSNLWLDKAGLMVDGWAILSGDVKMERKLGVSGDVTLSGNTSVNTLNATGAVDFDSTLNVDGATTFGNTLNVTGKTTLSDELHVVKSITTERNLYVTGNAKVGAFGSFGTYVSAAGSDNNGYGLIIDKNGNIKGNTDIGGTLGVTGAVDFDSTLNVDGATTLNGGVTVKTSTSNKSMTFDGEKIYRKNGTQAAGTFLFPSYGGTLVARPNSPLPPSGNIPMFDEYGNIVDSGNDAIDFYSMVEKTWDQLKAMRDGGTLVPGQWYRITDYVATTVQADTQSANHPFDIIVRADSTNKLNENAYAIKNAEDTTYFVNSKLEAWELKYSLDNDTNRFAWADATNNGKGVVYWMKDEFGNECPYDFKGIQFKAYGDTDNVFRYTFDNGDSSNNKDYSLHGGTSGGEYNSVYGNVIKPYLDADIGQKLNFIVFKGFNCRSNTFGDDCHSNTFSGRCSSNTFGDGCVCNTFGDSCFSNTFGDDCAFNTFGDDCQFNTFGSSCSYNTLGDNCNSNTFGTGCYHILFKNGTDTKNYVSDIIVESGNQYITLNMTGTSTSSAPYRNVTLAAGLNNTTTNKTITDSTNGGQPFKTVFQPAGSQVISV